MHFKKVFVISPIGKEDENGFDFTDLFLNHIVLPAVRESDGYAEPIRADAVPQPGPITAQIIRHIIDADVCIADITDHNPNVMYEIAIAHAADKPVILLKQGGGGGPFDIKDERAIAYGIRADEAANAREELAAQLARVSQNDTDPDFLEDLNPVRQIFRRMKERDLAANQDDSGLMLGIFDRIGDIEKALSQVTSTYRNESVNAVNFAKQNRASTAHVRQLIDILRRITLPEMPWILPARSRVAAGRARDTLGLLLKNNNWNTPSSHEFCSYADAVGDTLITWMNSNSSGAHQEVSSPAVQELEDILIRLEWEIDDFASQPRDH